MTGTKICVNITPIELKGLFIITYSLNRKERSGCMTNNFENENTDILNLQEAFTHVPKAIINAALQIRTVDQLNKEEQDVVKSIKEKLALGESLDNLTDNYSKIVLSKFPDIKINDADIDGKLKDLYMAVSKNQKDGALNTAMVKVLEITSKFPIFGKFAHNKLEEHVNETSVSVAMDQIREEMGECIKDLEDALNECDRFKQDCLMTANEFEVEAIALSQALEEMDDPELDSFQVQDFNQLDDLASRRYDILRRVETLKKIVITRRIDACRSINLKKVTQMSLASAVESNLLGITTLDSTISYGNSLNKVMKSQKFVTDLNEGIKGIRDNQAKYVKTSIENITKMTNLMTPDDMMKELENLQTTRNAIIGVKTTIEKQLEAGKNYQIEVTKLMDELYGSSKPELPEGHVKVLKPTRNDGEE